MTHDKTEVNVLNLQANLNPKSILDNR